MRTIALLPLLLVAAACSSTTEKYLGEQRGYDVITGFVISLKDLHEPVVEQLEDGTAYTVTNEGCTVVMEFESRMPGANRRQRQTYELKPGDKFVKSRPFSYLLIKRGR